MAGMEKTREGLCSLINKVDICLKGNVISNEEVLKIEEQFLTEAYKDGREHKTLFIQHTGSDYYDAIAFAIAVLSLIFMDETKAIDVTKDIEEGDIVTFRSKRWIYSGTTVIDGVERYVLKGDKDKMYIPEKSMCDVSPYNGKSKKLNGLGIGKSKSQRTEFLRNVAELKGTEISAAPSQSLVIFIDNHRFDELLNNVSFKFQGENYLLLDLVTASFFTDNNELRKRGNANNNEAMLKATLSIDKAREMIKEKHGNNIVGFIVFDDRAYKKYGMDLEELIYRKKLPYSLLVTKLSMNAWIRAQLENNKDILTLPYTAEYLKSIKDKQRVNCIVKETSTNSKFHEEIQCAEWGESRLQFVDSPFRWKDYKRIKENIAFVINYICLFDYLFISS